MSQELKGGTTTTSGTICQKNGLYKASDGKVEIVQYCEAGKPFPKFGGGTGTGNCTWTALSKSSDGSKTGFTSVKVAAGTM